MSNGKAYWANIMRDERGEPSSGRLLSLLALLGVFGIVAVLACQTCASNADALTTIAMTLIVGAFGGKSVQKFAEKKNSE